METAPVFLLHGLGSSIVVASLLPLEKYLNARGFSRTHRLCYPVEKLGFDECLDHLDEVMGERADKETEEIVLVGQSMGGVYANNLHRKGWKIRCAVYIGSPLHGAELLRQLERTVPRVVSDFFTKPTYEFLMKKEREEVPPHPYYTVTMSWPFCSEFDGCVYRSEAILEPERNTHLCWSDHRTVFASPRLLSLVHGLIAAPPDD